MATGKQMSLGLLQDSNLGQHSPALMSGIETIYEVCRLGEKGIATIICGQHLLPEEQSDKGIPYITGPADFGERTANPTRFAGVKKSLCMPGDVLLTVKGSGIGKVNLAPAFPAVIGRQLYAIRPHAQVLDQTFLYWVLQHELARLKDAVVSTTVPGIGRDGVKSLAIPLPSPSEQLRIVARIEELAARVERARGLRREALQEVETAVPAAARAVLSEVTAPPTRLKHWLDPRREGIQTGPFGAQLGTADFTDSGVPVVTIGNVQYSGINLDGLKFVSTAKAQQLGRFQIQAGDILFARMGTIGRCCVVPAAAEGWLINYHIIRVALDSSRVEPRYIHWAIRVSQEVEEYLAAKIVGATRGGVNSGIVSDLPFRIPSLNEQKQIVAYLDALQDKADTLKQAQAASGTELDALLPAVLERAFRGEL
jgi:type I restriction enzyme S subunit